MNNLSSKSLETECYSTVAEVASRGNFAPQSYPILSSSCRLVLVRKLISASRATIPVWSPSSGYGAWSNRASFAPVLAGRHALLRATHGVTTPSLGVSPGSSYHQTFEFSDGLFFGDAVNQSNFSGQAVKCRQVKLPFAIALVGIECRPIKITHYFRDRDNVT
jgi:hypothetical protein